MPEAKDPPDQTELDISVPVVRKEPGKIPLSKAYQNALEVAHDVLIKKGKSDFNESDSTGKLKRAINLYRKRLLEEVSPDVIGETGVFVKVGKEDGERFAWYDVKQNALIIAPEKIDRIRKVKPNDPEHPLEIEIRSPDISDPSKFVRADRVPDSSWISHGVQIVKSMYKLHDRYRYEPH